MYKIFTFVSLEQKIEALLFASEEPLGVTEISSILFEQPQEIRKYLRKIVKDYDARDTSLQITSVGKKYKMTLKPDFQEIVFPVATPEFTQDELKALTIILNSKKSMRGEITERLHERTESVIRDLKKRGMLKSERYRNTEIYSLTPKFYRYFNVKKKALTSEEAVERSESE